MAAPNPATSDEVITDSTISKAATPEPVITDPTASSSLCQPYRELIARWLDDGRTATSIFQELVEKHGFAARYATVQRFVRKLHGERSLRTTGTDTRPLTAQIIACSAGESASSLGLIPKATP